MRENIRRIARLLREAAEELESSYRTVLLPSKRARAYKKAEEDFDLDPEKLILDMWEERGYTREEAEEVIKSELKDWKAFGFTSKEARDWIESGFRAKEAKAWREAGFDDPYLASSWVEFAFEPEEAKAWGQVLENFIDPTIAADWSTYGFSPEEAEEVIRKFEDIVSDPRDVLNWIICGFTPEEAEAWIKAGISDPFEAEGRKDRGETPTKISSRRYSQRRRYFRR